jgi:hypothetical protein
MSRRRRTTVSALVASLALLATLPAPCACLPAPVAAAEHACCAPPAGIRPAEPGCCTAPAVAPDPVTASSVAKAAVAPALVVVAWVAPLAALVHDRGQASPGPAPSPPLTVRRL